MGKTIILTSEQERRFEEVVEESLAVGLDCREVDFDKVKFYSNKLYELNNLEKPKEYHTGTQGEFIELQNELLKKEGLSKQQRIETISNNCTFWTLYGRHEFYWANYYKFIVEIGCEIPPDLVEQLDCIYELLKEASWCQLGDGVAFLARAPKSQSADNRILSNRSGPALSFHDGFDIWAIGGVLVDEQIVMRPETQTIEQIQKEENIEVKRIRIEQYGWLNFLSKIGATELDFRENEIERTQEALYTYPTDEAGKVFGKILVTHCPSTARIYALEVDPQVNTCVDAQKFLSSGSQIDEILGNKVRVIGRT